MVLFRESKICTVFFFFSQESSVSATPKDFRSSRLAWTTDPVGEGEKGREREGERVGERERT